MSQQDQKTRLFYTFCMHQHVCEVLPGTELHSIGLKLLEENPKFTRSITLDNADCVACLIDVSRERSEYLEFFWDWEFCHEHGGHSSKCPTSCKYHVVWPPEITWGKYSNQMKYLPEPEH